MESGLSDEGRASSVVYYMSAMSLRGLSGYTSEILAPQPYLCRVPEFPRVAWVFEDHA